ncbi:hypothetical protein RSAG8_04034, partial [Rhizoctonia solani AG-8 WAC10335]
MSHNTHHIAFPVDPSLTYRAGAYGSASAPPLGAPIPPPGVPMPPQNPPMRHVFNVLRSDSEASIATSIRELFSSYGSASAPPLGAPIPPPGVPMPPQNPPMPLGPPAVLVGNVADILEPMRQELQRMVETMKGVSEASQGVVETVKKLDDRIHSLEAIVQKLNLHAGSDADDEGEEGPRQVKRVRRTREPKKQIEGKVPPSNQRELMFPIVRKALYPTGCEVSDMKELKEGLSSEELKKRITEDPAEPWRPDFLKSHKHADNAFWLDKVMTTVLDHPDAKTQVGEGKNKIAPEYWTRECIQDHVLSVIWGSAKRAVQRTLDPGKNEKAQMIQSTNNKKTRSERLFRHRYNLVVGDKSHPPIKVVVKGEARVVPPKLMVSEIMSDVVTETFGYGSIPPGVTLEKYKKGREGYKYEGISPFYRNEIWNPIFAEMDKVMGARGTPLQARYYASEDLRGQRDEDPEKALEIPVHELYRCHISNVWYNRLPDSMKQLVKPSPKGWELDEELKPVEHMDLGAD